MSISGVLREYSVFLPDQRVVECPRESHFLLMRHCGVENPDGGPYGKDPRYPLSAMGREQASRLAREFSVVWIGAIFCGPLERAVESTEIVRGRRHLPLIVEAALDEVYGDPSAVERAQSRRFLQRVSDCGGMGSVLAVTHRAIIHEILEMLGLQEVARNSPIWPVTIIWTPMELLGNEE